MFRRKKKDAAPKEPVKGKGKQSTPVFNDDMLGIPHGPEKMTEEDHKEEKRDKIFGNDFNTGNIDIESLPDIKIDASYAKSNLEDCYNADDYAEKKAIMDAVYAAFHESQWKNLPLTKKFSKELMPYIFNDLFKAIDGNGFTATDMFIAIAEFMDISYERVYEIAGLKMKERLIHELENKYKILSKKNIKRLF